MSRPRKYRPGPPIHALHSFAFYLEQGYHFFYRGKFQANGWARGWQVGWAMVQVQMGHIRVAEPVEAPDGRH